MKLFKRILSLFLANAMALGIIGSFPQLTSAAGVTISDPWTIVDDSDPAVTFEGTWNRWDGHGDGSHNDTQGYTGDPSASASFTFTGNTVAVISSRDGNQGIMSIQIDDGTPVEVDCYAQTGNPRSLVYMSDRLSDGEHTIVVRPAGKHGPDPAYSDNVAIDAFAYATLPAGDIWTTVDDKDKRVVFDGTWYDWSNQGDMTYMDTQTYSGDPAASATFRFTGNKVRLISKKDQSQGILSVSIDGEPATEINCYSADTQLLTVVYESRLLTTGEHTIMVKPTGRFGEDPAWSPNIAVDAFQIATIDEQAHIYANAESLWTKVDDSDGSISYTEGWATRDIQGSYGGSVHFSETKDARATYSFTGTKARFYGALKNEVGIAKVYVDGQFKTQIDCKDESQTTYDALLYETDTLEPGDHTLAIEVTNVTTGGGTSGTEILVDAFASTSFGYDDQIVYKLAEPSSGFSITEGTGVSIKDSFVEFDRTAASGSTACVLQGPDSVNIPSGKYTLTIYASLEEKTGTENRVLGLDIEKGTPKILDANVYEKDFAQTGVLTPLTYNIHVPMNAQINLRFWWEKTHALKVDRVVVTPVRPDLSKHITIDAADEGRMFEGIGAISASSSTLLYDYEEPYRSDVLDYLFKPNFGAAYQHLKVEVGGDGNSTNGTEPPYARTLEEFELVQKVRTATDKTTAAYKADYEKVKQYFNRGIEFWLMKEAKKRNPDIYLDILQWSAPGWLRYNGEYGSAANMNAQYELWKKQKFYTQDNADYIASFVWGAKEFHNLDIDYVGIWNEHYNPDRNDWIVLLRKTLDQYGLEQVKITAAEANHWPTIWQSATELTSTEELRNAVDSIGVHYPNWGTPNPYHDNTEAQNCGKPLWSSEDGVWSGTWDATLKSAKLFNRNYIENRIVKTIAWSALSASYPGLALSTSGAMTSNEPWSGYYVVEPGIWGFAHTTQFTQPGWRYMNEACGYLDAGGSYVALRAEGDNPDYSIIIETTDATEVQTVTFDLTGMADKDVQVWRTNKSNQFAQLEPVKPEGDSFTVRIDPQCIYTLSTTTGQQKGQAQTAVPAQKEFPLDYADNFDTYADGEHPKYFSDQIGAFEVVNQEGQSPYLRQVVTQKPVCWWNDYEPFTFLGNAGLSDYIVSTKTMIEEKGYSSLYGRVTGPKYGQTHPFGYGFRVYDDGRWQLTVYKDKKSNNLGDYYEVLASGTSAEIKVGEWAGLKLRFMKNNISGYINDKKVFSYTDAERRYMSGRAGVGGSYDYIRYDDFNIHNLDSDASFIKIDDNAEDAPITYSSEYMVWHGGGYKDTQHYTYTAGNEATFTFTGVRARYYGFKRYDLGIVEILVDGIKKDTIDLYSDGVTEDTLLYETELLELGEHTLTVRLTDQMNPNSTKLQAIIDAFSYSTQPPVSVPAESVLLNEAEIKLPVGKTFQLIETVLPDTATNQAVTWKTSNASVATVSSSGLVTAVGPGTADITVTTEDGNKSASCKVEVYRPVDKSKLRKLIESCEKRKEEDYTEATWAQLDKALTEARKTVDDVNATQEQVDSALDDLQKTYDALEKKPIPDPDPKPEPDEPYTGWKEIGSLWYYYKDDVLQKGWLAVNNHWFYLDAKTGARQDGWQKVNGRWYLLSADGVMQTGWQQSGGEWYFLESSGKMTTGWKKLGKWYYFHAKSGAMQTGWLQSGGKWYFLESSGKMTTGWKKLGKWYYFNTSGQMLQNTTKAVGNTRYRFAPSGICLNP